MKNFYETLGIKKTASKDQIKKAYRKKSMKSHPDQGGNAKEFDTINKAYRVLVNEENRAKYDSGEDPESILKTAQNEENKSIQIVAQMYVGIVMANDPKTTNIIKQIRSQLENTIVEIKKVLKTEEDKKEKFLVSLKRFKTSKKENFFENIANSQIANIDKTINQGKEAKEDLGKALKFLEDYSYSVDEIVMPRHAFSAGWDGNIPTSTFQY